MSEDKKAEAIQAKIDRIRMWGVIVNMAVVFIVVFVAVFIAVKL
jgi:hypothetical protein